MFEFDISKKLIVWSRQNSIMFKSGKINPKETKK